jgi:hypothetical protein
MKISKIAVAAIFAAGFVSVPTTLVMADTREQDDLMVIQCLNEYTEEDGYKCIETTPEEGVAYTTEEGDVDVKPMDSCWKTEDGVDVCGRGVAPEPRNPQVIENPYKECYVSSETEEGGWMACPDSSPLDGAAEEPGGVRFNKDGQEDSSLMMQNGVAKSAGTPDQTASNTLAAFGVLVAALGALGIGISRQKEAK